MNRHKRTLPIALSLLLTFIAAGLAAAQTTYDIRSGEVLAVKGNRLVVRGPEGVRQFVIPDDFRFDLDGKQLSVHELKPGMKLTALIKTTEVPVELTLTELRNAEVVHTIGTSVVVRNTDTGQYRRFTNEEMKDLDLVIYRNGQVVDPMTLRQGDRVSALVVTKLPPVVLTDREVAVLAQNAPPPPQPPPPAPAAQAQAPPPPPPPPAPAALPKTGSSLPLVGALGLAALGLGGALTVWRKLAAR